MSWRELTLRDGSTVAVLGEEGRLVRTRAGTKIHRGRTGSSVTECGVWLRTDGAYFQVDPARVERGNLCESCFGSPS